MLHETIKRINSKQWTETVITAFVSSKPKTGKFNTTSIHELQSKQQLPLTTTSFVNTIRETSKLNSKNYKKKKKWKILQKKRGPNKLSYLIDGKNLSIALLDFLKLPQEVPIINKRHHIVSEILERQRQILWQTKRERSENRYIPELGFGTDLVSCPKLHAVDLRMLIALCWKCSPDHLVLVKLFSPTNKQSTIFLFRSMNDETQHNIIKDVNVTYPEGNHF